MSKSIREINYTTLLLENPTVTREDLTPSSADDIILSASKI